MGAHSDDAKIAFIVAIRSSSDLSGINDINLATAACAVLEAERVSPGAEETRLMRAAFDALGRPDVYDRVKAVLDCDQP